MSAETYVFPPPPVVSLPIEGSQSRFPVRRVFCVGRNYAAHAREMGHDPDRDPPFFFIKNREDVVDIAAAGGRIAYPAGTADFHHEIELVVALGGGGTDILEEGALPLVYGYAVGLDLTRRDVQAEAKKLSRPWSTAKSFAQSAPIGGIRPASLIGHPASGAIRASVGGAVRQEGDLAEMIWPVAGIIAHLSRWFDLAAGDLIFTGTPAGVGTLVRGDFVEGSIESVGSIAVTVV